MGETVIEICGEKNESVLFSVTNEHLRGRWNSAVSGGRATHEALGALHAAMPGGYCPGIYLSFNPQERLCKRIDPLLDTDEGKKCWASMERVLKEHESILGNGRPWPTVLYANLDDTDVKTWAYALRQLIDSKLARYVSGPQLPPLSDIAKLPGSVKLRGSYIGLTENDKLLFTVDPKGKRGEAA